MPVGHDYIVHFAQTQVYGLILESIMSVCLRTRGLLHPCPQRNSLRLLSSNIATGFISLLILCAAMHTFIIAVIELSETGLPHNFSAGTCCHCGCLSGTAGPVQCKDNQMLFGNSWFKPVPLKWNKDCLSTAMTPIKELLCFCSSAIFSPWLSICHLLSRLSIRRHLSLPSIAGLCLSKEYLLILFQYCDHRKQYNLFIEGWQKIHDLVRSLDWRLRPTQMKQHTTKIMKIRTNFEKWIFSFVFTDILLHDCVHRFCFPNVALDFVPYHLD